MQSALIRSLTIVEVFITCAMLHQHDAINNTRMRMLQDVSYITKDNEKNFVL